MKLIVNIEYNGRQRLVGTIEGSSQSDARFQYDEAFLHSPDSMPVSISLPLQDRSFSASQTKRGILRSGGISLL